MLLLLSGCLVGSGMWSEWHWNWLPTPKGCLAAILPKAVLGNWDTVFPNNHTPIRGVLYQTTPSVCTMMNVCNNGSFNGFWAKCNVMRPGLVASAGLELNFG